MYKYTIEDFGEWKKHRLYNAANGNGLEVVPEVGGTLLQLWLAERSILHGCKTPEELKENQAYKNTLLFPFPNRLDEGRYEYLADYYQFPINEAATQTALHGFGKAVTMDVLQHQCEENSAVIRLSYFYEGDQKYYPFPFLLDVEYRLDDQQGFSLLLRFSNEAEHAIPVGLGWHPYFQVSKTIDELSLQLPTVKLVEVNDRMLPTGQLLPYTYFEHPRRVGKTVLDNAFALQTKEEKVEVHLRNEELTLVYWQESQEDQFNYLQVYTPGDRKSIAIEPMTCNIDAFNNGDGLSILQPEKFLEVRCGVKLAE